MAFPYKQQSPNKIKINFIYLNYPHFIKHSLNPKPIIDSGFILNSIITINIISNNI
jgi:hypothetical protein